MTQTKTEEGLDDVVDVARGVSLEKRNSAAINYVNLAPNLIGSDHKRLQDFPYEALTSALASGTYFAVHATKHMRPEGKKLSLYSAIG